MLKPNYEAEMSVIGSILMEPKTAMPLAALKLTEEDFKTGELRTLYGACLKLFKEQKPVDSVTVVSIVGDEYKPTIMLAAETAPHTSHVSAYIDAVKERSQKIAAYDKAMQFIESIEDESLSVEQCRSGAAEVVNCFNEEDQQDAVTADQGYLDFIDRMEHPKSHIKTGYSQLDRFMYIDKGDFIVIGGRPNAGKTAFTLQMMLHMAQDRRIGYFSLETSPQKVFDRLVSNYAWTSLTRIKNAKLEDSDWESVTSNYDTFKQLGFEIVPAAGCSTFP